MYDSRRTKIDKWDNIYTISDRCKAELRGETDSGDCGVGEPPSPKNPSRPLAHLKGEKMPIVTDSIPHRLDQRLRQIYIQEHERFNLEERARKLGEALKKNKGETTRQYS